MAQGKTHAESGIKRKPSEPVYTGDILSGLDYQMAKGPARGCWLQCLLHIWHNDTDRIEGTIDDLAALWNETRERAEDAILGMMKHKVCDILFDGQEVDEMQVKRFVTKCNTLNGQFVTLINRRKSRAQKVRKQTLKRVQEHRERELQRTCNAPVTCKKGTSSVSSSFSSSPSGRITPVTPLTEREINISDYNDIRDPEKYPAVALALHIIGESKNKVTCAFMHAAHNKLGDARFRDAIATFWSERKVDAMKHPGKVLTSKLKTIMEAQ